MSWHLQSICLLLDDWNRPQGPLAASLLECGDHYFDQLRSAADGVVAGNDAHQSNTTLQNIIDTAYREMQTTDSQFMVFSWRRLYTDASILMALVHLHPTTAMESIATLDRAIVIAGAAGHGRLDMILSVIEKIQSEFYPTRLFTGISLSRRICPTVKNLELSTSIQDIPCFETPPSFVAFQNQCSRHPFVLRAYAEDWPALQNHPWRSAEYLHSVSGEGRVVPVEVGKDYRTDDWKQTWMSWDEFLSHLDFDDQPHSRDASDVLYLAQHDLTKQFPALREDILIPDYAYSSLSIPEYSSYKPPGNEEQLVLSAWLGPKGTISPAHTDPYFNLYVQVVGRKTVWLAPPRVSPFMRVPNWLTSNNASSMSNTSHMDVFMEKEDDEHREFWANVVPRAMNATLNPGDLLFFPPGWWHAMRSEDTSFSVSLWF